MNQAAMKRYHKWVANQPCMNCHIEGYSQASHYQGLHGDRLGRGAGKKAHDMAVTSLCCDRPGFRGCHSLFDNHELAPSMTTEDRFINKVGESEMHLCWEMQTIIAAYEAGAIKLP